MAKNSNTKSQFISRLPGVFSDVALRDLLDICQCFAGTCCLYIAPRRKKFMIRLKN